MLLLLVSQSCPILCNSMNCSIPGFSFTISQCLLKLTPMESVMPFNYLFLCNPPLLPSIFPSIRVFSNELTLRIQWPKYWSFSISHPNEYWGFISFRIDWFDLLAVQGTLKSFLQLHSLKASTLQNSAFFMAQLSHQYNSIESSILNLVCST